MPEIKVGLLGLYLKLYEDICPFMQPEINGFYNIIKKELESTGLEVVTSGIYTEKEHCFKAIRMFEEKQACAVITLHLAYSPSLESVDALCSTKLPLILLDTTPQYSFDCTASPDAIMYNHGIHGVQDLSNLLIRFERDFFLEAGHYKNSDVIVRVAGLCKAAYIARKLSTARIGIIGKPFKGMGDFQVPFDELERTLGIKAVQFGETLAKELKKTVTAHEIDEECEKDKTFFVDGGCPEDVHRHSVEAGLIIRKWIENNNLSGFTFNFLSITAGSCLACVPFLEASKAMARGVGYAGEGDILTAALCGALAAVYPETTFSEMFCPDWEGNSIFLSHMGEMNIRIASEKMHLKEMNFPYTDAKNPAAAYGRYRPGRALTVSLAPVGDEKYRLLLSEMEMLATDDNEEMEGCIRGRCRPSVNVAEFLKQYSLAGGTHHIVLIYGGELELISAFGKMMGFEVLVIS